MVTDDFANDEVEELLRKVRIQMRVLCQLAQTCDLLCFTSRVCRRQIVSGLEHADCFGAAETLCKHVNERRVDIVDRYAVLGKLLACRFGRVLSHRPLTSSSYRPSGREASNRLASLAGRRPEAPASHPAAPWANQRQGPRLRPASAMLRAASDPSLTGQACRRPSCRQGPSWRRGRPWPRA